MKYIKQFAIIIAISLFGEILHALLPIPVPTSIYGIVILFILLETGVIKLEAVKECANFLTGAMSIMFVPPVVALIDNWVLIANDWYKYIIIAVFSTFMVILASGRVTQLFIKMQNRGSK